MTVLLSDMLSPEERIAMGLTLQRIGIDYSAKESEGNTYTLTLIKESGQVFQFQEVDFKDGICPIVQIDIGSLHVTASLVSWKEIIADIDGKSIYTVTLVQYASIFMKPIAITEIFRVPSSFIERGAVVDASGLLQKPFLNKSTVWVSTTLVNRKIFGPSIKAIFKELVGASFSMGNTNTTFNFDGLLVDSDSPDLITMRDSGTTLYDIIKDYSIANNFEYKLIFTKKEVPTVSLGIPTTVNVTEISFLRTGVTDETSHLAQGFFNVFDALMATHEGEIINAEQGYSVAKDFKQSAEHITNVNLDEQGHPESYDTDTYTIIHPGILGYANFGEKTKVSVVRGGFESDFLHFTAGDIHQFWGFKGDGTLKEEPDDMVKMEQILNNENIVDEDTNLREFMNLWGRQFVINSTHLTQIEPFTPEQEAALAQEEEAMFNLIEALLAYFNSFPVRQLGDDLRNTKDIFENFLLQYKIDHPEIGDEPTTSLYGSLSKFRIAVLFNGNISPSRPADGSILGMLDFMLNNVYIIPQDPAFQTPLPSIDDILFSLTGMEPYISEGFVIISLKSTQVSLEKTRTNIIIPESVQVKNMCFPSVDHPLIENSRARANWRSSDGRWPAYIELPELPGSASVVNYEWASKIVSTINHVELDKKHYIRVDVRQLNNYYIITLPGQLLQIKSTKSEGTTKITLKVIERIESAYVATEDTKKLYGPFIISEGKLLDENSQKFIDILSDSTKYLVNNIIRDTLVPEAFNEDGTLTKIESIKAMKNFILRNYKTFNARLVWAHRFGSLTVAGLPAEEAYSLFVFPDGATVNRVSVNFGIDGVRTTYYVDSPDHEDLKGVKVKQPDPHEDKEEPEKIKNEEPKIDEPKLESDPKQNTLSDNEMGYIYKKPEGGQGIIVGKSVVSGPRYNVRRVNYGDIDPETFAGGKLVTGQYFTLEWVDVINLAESINSVGLLLPGTRVNISIFSDSEHGPYLPYMEQTPPNSAPGIILLADSIRPFYAIALTGTVWGIPATLEEVVNVQEPEGFGGNLLPGTPVSVQLYGNGENFYISHAPQTFAPPLPG